MAKYLRKPPQNGNIAMRLAGILFCLTMLSIYMVGGLFARYTTSGQGGDSARVITFGAITLTETGDFYDQDKGLMWIVPGKDIKKDAEVTFEGSEAATYVFVEAQVSEHWSCSDGVFTMAGGKISWTVADGWERLTDSVYYRSLAPNEVLENADIIKNGIITVSDGITRGQMQTITQVDGVEKAVTVVFRAFSVQSNGFASAQAAWDSLKGKGGPGE